VVKSTYLQGKEKRKKPEKRNTQRRRKEARMGEDKVVREVRGYSGQVPEFRLNGILIRTRKN